MYKQNLADRKRLNILHPHFLPSDVDIALFLFRAYHGTKGKQRVLYVEAGVIQAEHGFQKERDPFLRLGNLGFLFLFVQILKIYGLFEAFLQDRRRDLPRFELAYDLLRILILPCLATRLGAFPWRRHWIDSVRGQVSFALSHPLQQFE